MGRIRAQRPVLLIAAAFSRHPEALEWAQDTAQQSWGPIALASDLFDFNETQYYERTMGSNIRKCFWAFERLVDAGLLPQLKLKANDWEAEYRGRSTWSESRPLNIDPGYLTEAKVVLASTKDRDHRIYLDRGIFAEVTLYFKDRNWCSREWTYPDYRRADYHQFFTRCREYLRDRYQRLGDIAHPPA